MNTTGDGGLLRFTRAARHAAVSRSGLADRAQRPELTHTEAITRAWRSVRTNALIAG